MMVKMVCAAYSEPLFTSLSVFPFEKLMLLPDFISCLGYFIRLCPIQLSFGFSSFASPFWSVLE
jgi:hypothetical protein